MMVLICIILTYWDINIVVSVKQRTTGIIYSVGDDRELNSQN